MGFGELNN